MPFYKRGEPREATVIWEIYTAGEWILPLRNGHIIPSKPPLFHWLGALVSLAWGEVSELTIRLPSALLAILGVLLTYGVGTALWGVEVGLIAALILTTSFEWIQAARTARVDMTLTVCMVMAFLFFLFLYRRHKASRIEALLFFFLLGLATLAKGPVGALLPGLTVGMFLALQRDLRFLRQLHLVPGSVLLVLIAGSWYGLALWQGGQEFFAKQILKENVLRFFDSGAAGAGHEHPFYYFVPKLFRGMAPWSFFFPPLAVFLYQRRRTWTADGYLYLLIWIATVFVFYSASSSKRPVYILPLYPAVALLLGAWWQELRQGTAISSGVFSWLLRASGYLCLLVLSLTVATVFAQLLGHDPLDVLWLLRHSKDPITLSLFTNITSTHPLAFLLWCGVAGPSVLFLGRSIQRQQWGWVFTTLVVVMISTFLLVHRVLQPAIAAACTFRPFMTRVMERVGNTPLFFYRTFDHGALFYAGRRVPFYDPSRRQPESPCFLLMREEEWAKLAPRAGSGLRAVEVSEGIGPERNYRLVLVSVAIGVTVPLENETPADPSPHSYGANLKDGKQAFTTVESDPVLVGAGDIAKCWFDWIKWFGGAEETAALLDRIRGTVFTTGDNVYSNGTAAAFRNCYDPTWGRHKARTRPSLGNHDYNSSDAGPYYTYFGDNAGVPGRGYYSYNLGAWHIVSLNSNIAAEAGSEQERWLRADLTAHQTRCTLAYWHHPLFSSGRGNDSHMRDIWRMLYEFRVDVVVNGHHHGYERFAPQNPDGEADDERGIREFVVGTGGARLHGFRKVRANSEVRNSSTWGVLKLTLHATEYDWDFIPVAGGTFRDAGSAACIP
ncbi:MAG TPA: glycosyltransferase family 39 protein [Candidatus Binatia bacterium]|nr:glycosyltransferase family 39 protein [Candidatus Binatia bacterium]